MDSKEDTLVKISIEDDEQDTNEDIQNVPDDNQQAGANIVFESQRRRAGLVFQNLAFSG